MGTFANAFVSTVKSFQKIIKGSNHKKNITGQDNKWFFLHLFLKCEPTMGVNDKHLNCGKKKNLKLLKYTTQNTSTIYFKTEFFRNEYKKRQPDIKCLIYVSL